MAKASVDDIEKKAGKFVFADHLDVPFGFDGQFVTLDLSAANYEMLSKVCLPVLKAGTPTDSPEPPALVQVPEPAAVPEPVAAPVPAQEPAAVPVVDQEWPDPVTGQPGPYAMKNANRTWLLRPDITRFAKENLGGTSGRGRPTADVQAAYDKARREGTFVPAEKLYPARYNVNTKNAPQPAS